MSEPGFTVLHVGAQATGSAWPTSALGPFAITPAAGFEGTRLHDAVVIGVTRQVGLAALGRSADLAQAAFDTRIRSTKPGAKPIRLSDEKGLYLEVSPSGGKWWRLKYRFAGKENLLSMGTYPHTGLKVAREKRDRARALLAEGVDPSATRRAEKESRSTAVVNGFEAVAREWHATIHLTQVSVGMLLAR